MDHEYFMRRAIKLAEKGRGTTSPNPLVGAVIVKNGRIIGEGYHLRAGEAHAEINALNSTKENARGATLYVTLEPCCFHGKTPPCTEAVIRAKIAKVVVGLIDPNPRVCGKGIKKLKEAKVEVISGILSSEVKRQNEAYIKRVTTGKPFVLMKVGMTLNGKIAEERGRETVITCEEARKFVHKLRSEFDAVMVGRGTVLSDDPELTVREVAFSKQPKRIIVSTDAQIPLEANVVRTANLIHTYLATTPQASHEQINKLKSNGVKVIVVASTNNRLDLNALLELLGKQKINSILLEGGSHLNTSMIEAGLVDKF
ncbi:MAG: bifunctional diaminohydroxyphosphoribosylaminopyrimidine deaminase/5-amino-6-(5-phosphoribosylamino)uracil reductase RibD, partial [Candidatus Subteraquimicrobiales bacterium]|nr:bifunctional diaminohydroxyphosphoribosylaminopyrimidine deaminase/5-amino-6-(5-phosphoribosylamino)uracil reductase RibD [Candidatus Subteraquimicrobiales bacterium]